MRSGGFEYARNEKRAEKERILSAYGDMLREEGLQMEKDLLI